MGKINYSWNPSYLETPDKFDNSNKIATTEFVNNAIKNSKANYYKINFENTVEDIASPWNDENTIYACGFNFLKKSTDKGKTWKDCNFTYEQWNGNHNGSFYKFIINNDLFSTNHVDMICLLNSSTMIACLFQNNWIIIDMDNLGYDVTDYENLYDHRIKNALLLGDYLYVAYINSDNTYTIFKINLTKHIIDSNNDLGRIYSGFNSIIEQYKYPQTIWMLERINNYNSTDIYFLYSTHSNILKIDTGYWTQDHNLKLHLNNEEMDSYYKMYLNVNFNNLYNTDIDSIYILSSTENYNDSNDLYYYTNMYDKTMTSLDYTNNQIRIDYDIDEIYFDQMAMYKLYNNGTYHTLECSLNNDSNITFNTFVDTINIYHLIRYIDGYVYYKNIKVTNTNNIINNVKDAFVPSTTYNSDIIYLFNDKELCCVSIDENAYNLNVGNLTVDNINDIDYNTFIQNNKIYTATLSDDNDGYIINLDTVLEHGNTIKFICETTLNSTNSVKIKCIYNGNLIATYSLLSGSSNVQFNELVVGNVYEATFVYNNANTLVLVNGLNYQNLSVDQTITSTTISARTAYLGHELRVTNGYSTSVIGTSGIGIYDSNDNATTTINTNGINTTKISVGSYNSFNSDSQYCSIISGIHNTIDSSRRCSIIGSDYTTIKDSNDSVSISHSNDPDDSELEIDVNIKGSRSVLIGGFLNQIDSYQSIILGGECNKIINSSNSIIIGGNSEQCKDNNNIIEKSNDSIIINSVYSTVKGNETDNCFVDNSGIILSNYSNITNDHMEYNEDDSADIFCNNVIIGSNYSNINSTNNSDHYNKYSSIISVTGNDDVHSELIGTASSMLAGWLNHLYGVYSVIIGGNGNTLGRYINDTDDSNIFVNNSSILTSSNSSIKSSDCSIIGGFINTINEDCRYSIILSGSYNNINSSTYSSIIGGDGNSDYENEINNCVNSIILHSFNSSITSTTGNLNNCGIILSNNCEINKNTTGSTYNAVIIGSAGSTIKNNENWAYAYSSIISSSGSSINGAIMSNILGGFSNSLIGQGNIIIGGLSNNINDGYYSTIIGGCHTIANSYQVVIGHYNNPISSKQGTDFTLDATGTAGSALIIGNGSSDTNRNNCFRVDYDGVVYAEKHSTSAADYAEFIEWQDGNPNNEDRVGYFACVIGKKMRIANSKDNIKLIGVVSGNPGVIGDAQSEHWKDKYLTDIFGRLLTQKVHYNAITEINEETGEEIIIQPEYDSTEYILNPEYDKNKEYIPREQRPEFDCFGMVGKLVVIDDGTCEEGQFCFPNDNGIATKADDGFYVMERLDDSHIRILLLR